MSAIRRKTSATGRRHNQPVVARRLHACGIARRDRDHWDLGRAVVACHPGGPRSRTSFRVHQPSQATGAGLLATPRHIWNAPLGRLELALDGRSRHGLWAGAAGFVALSYSAVHGRGRPPQTRFGWQQRRDYDATAHRSRTARYYTGVDAVLSHATSSPSVSKDCASVRHEQCHGTESLWPCRCLTMQGTSDR